MAPASVNVPIGGRTQFALSPAQGASWSVDGNVGGNDTVGHISLIGGYTAPFVIPSASTALPSGNPVLATVAVGASVATNTSTVSIVRRFVHETSVLIGTCSPSSSACINALAVADLNGDDLSDLVTANTDSGTFSVTLRASASSFSAPAPSYPVGTPATSQPQALAIADLDNNSTLDVVVGDAGATRAVRSRLGAGDGAFGSEVATVLTNTSDPFSMAVGQFEASSFDNVPDLDVAIARFGNPTDPSELTIFRGDSLGGFSLVTAITAGVSLPVSVIAADFNNDQLDDLAVANSGGTGAAANTVSVFFGVGDGTFQSAELYAVAGGPSAVVAVDLNGDQFLDLAVTAAVDNTLTFILNRGASWVSGDYFQSPPFQTYTTGAVPIALTASDVNGDLLPDLVVVNRDDDTVSVFLSHGDGTAVLSETYKVGAMPQAVAVGDFNGDSFPDLAVANSDDDTVTILRNRGQ
jgi:hypothetical protein